MNEVKRVPVAFFEEIDTVYTVFSKGEVGPFFDNKIFGRRFDHALIIRQLERISIRRSRARRHRVDDQGRNSLPRTDPHARSQGHGGEGPG